MAAAAAASAAATPKGKAAITYKFLMLGDSGAGKSCLSQRFTKGEGAPMNLGTTLGVDVVARTVAVGTSLVRLQIWDTAGQEKFRALAANFYRGSHGVVVVYDVTSRPSFDAVAYWLQCIKEHELDCAAVLVGNKSDLAASRVSVKRLHVCETAPHLASVVQKVTAAEGRALATKQGVPFFETSALTGEHVEDAYMTLARAVHKKVHGTDVPEPVSAAGVKPDKPAPAAVSAVTDTVKLDAKPADASSFWSNCPC